MDDFENIQKEESIQKKSKNDIFLKIISVLTAMFIWFWVVGFESRVAKRTFASIPVNFENAGEIKTKYNYSVITEKELYIDVVLEGKSADLNRIKSENIYAYINLGKVTQAGEQSLPIEIKEMDYVNIAAQSQNSTLLYIDKLSYKNIPVNAKIIQMVKDPDFEIGELDINTKFISVSGPEEILETIDQALVNLSLGNIERSVKVTERFILINKDGEEVKNQYISAGETTAVEVTVPVTMTKEIPLSVNYKYGYYNEKNSKITIIPDKIKIKGSPEFINGMSGYNIGVINEKKYENSTTITMPVSLPEGIISDTISAEIEIQFIEIDSKTINVSFNLQNINFNVIPPLNSEYHIKEERIQINILGHPSVLKSINASKISVTADMSALIEKGTHLIPLDIEIKDNDIKNPAFCVGEYLINAEIY